MIIWYALLAILVLILSFYSIKYEKKVINKLSLKRYRLGLYILNRIILSFSLLACVQLISVYFNLDESTLFDIDVLIFAIIISTSYLFKRLLIHHLLSISSNHNIVRKVKFLLGSSILFLILYAVFELCNISPLMNTILSSTIIFFLIMSIFLYAQERLIIYLDSKHIDKTVVIFTSRMFLIIMIVVFTIVIMQIFEVSTAPILTIIGAASLAIGLSLQTSLANLAAGILLVIFRPYKIGNIVRIDTEIGTVVDINFLYTEMRTFSGETLFMPNALSLHDKGISNYSTCRYRRIELLVDVDYETKIEKALKVGLDTLNDIPLILKIPNALGGIENFGDSAITLKFWVYVRPKDFLEAQLNIRTNLLNAFRKNKIEIPFNKMVVRIEDMYKLS